ncbi:MAG: (Fe-S)-binding protein [Pirellulaceae bacterium]|nr:(Fe-S)-binding protein [Pirellulaceae bacterium]
MARSNEGQSKTDDWFHRWILFGLFPNRERLRQAMTLARWSQRLGVDRLADFLGLPKLLPTQLQQLVAMLPPLSKPLDELPTELPAKGPRRARVALFRGCIGDVMFDQTQWATARVLQENGCDVIVPPGQECCGAIHFHAGNELPARELADTNLRAIPPDDYDAIIVNVAGCGSMLKDYGLHWRDSNQPERAAFAAKTKDVHEFLDELGLIPPKGEIRQRATYHDACHLAHAQQIREAPRRLLNHVPGLELVPLPESELCCGAAGTYNLTEPEMAGQLAQRKLANILSTKASLVITANAGCLLQIAKEARIEGQPLRLLHPMDILDRSYRGLPIE